MTRENPAHQPLNNSTDSPKVSVIMNCFNSDEYLREAIDCVYAQTFGDWEIVFWDNASTDASSDIAKSYDKKLKYFCGEETVPLGRARNMAIERARGKYIAFLDCDDIWLPEKLARQVSVLEENEDISFVFTNTIRFDAKGDVASLNRGYNSSNGRIFGDLLKGNFITIASVMVRKDALESLSEVFDERFNMSEDWDLWLRLSYSHKVAYIGEALTKWRINPESWTHTKFVLFSGETENIIKKLENNYPSVREEYSDGISKMKDASVFYKGIGMWVENKKGEARKTLKPYITKNKKFFIGYLMTFLPSNLMITFEKIYFKLDLGRFISH
ncbi:MAG: glycosyltransferase [Candidatus Omnitrophica bacterium]|nr:glycosyltransferase [Candidatus Omnitrophota bacterium]